jgi:hypothetical protein
MSNTVKYSAIDLIEYINTTLDVECMGCDKTEGSWNEDDADFAKELHKKGWRKSIKGNLYCPKCAKKKLKKYL